MMNFDAVDFSERRSEEVISVFWRSVYMKEIRQEMQLLERKQECEPKYSVTIDPNKDETLGAASAKTIGL